jgi:hypothetical protein
MAACFGASRAAGGTGLFASGLPQLLQNRAVSFTGYPQYLQNLAMRVSSFTAVFRYRVFLPSEPSGIPDLRCSFSYNDYNIPYACLESVTNMFAMHISFVTHL